MHVSVLINVMKNTSHDVAYYHSKYFLLYTSDSMKLYISEVSKARMWLYKTVYNTGHEYMNRGMPAERCSAETIVKTI